MFDTVGREKLFELAKVFAANPYQYRSGWPDLTLIRDKSIKFVEVKTTDNLHKSQLRGLRANGTETYVKNVIY
ncbi:VRR-NUC domain-containing protein [Salmonella enterica]|nr:VRR-NUC domain-containing protein [Salmonella enterica]EID4191756.1 VRR-NUC domain-containing protein [Salmonella enterica]